MLLLLLPFFDYLFFFNRSVGLPCHLMSQNQYTTNLCSFARSFLGISISAIKRGEWDMIHLIYFSAFFINDTILVTSLCFLFICEDTQEIPQSQITTPSPNEASNK